MDSTERFTERLENYARYRPGYPEGVVKLLGRGPVVADIGSGTGLLARPFLDAGYKVIGVEPNRAMREAGENLLAGYSQFRSVNGRAEATGLEDASVDVIVAGQAFHWFDPEATKGEWNRILRAGGTIGLVWNERHTEGPFMTGIARIVDHYARERDADGSIREAGKGRIAGFFAPAEFKLAEFPNQQEFDFAGLRGRVLSSSYLPGEGEAGCEELTAELKTVFERYQIGGKVAFIYRTRVYYVSG